MTSASDPLQSSSKHLPLQAFVFGSTAAQLSVIGFPRAQFALLSSSAPTCVNALRIARITARIRWRLGKSGLSKARSSSESSAASARMKHSAIPTGRLDFSRRTKRSPRQRRLPESSRNVGDLFGHHCSLPMLCPWKCIYQAACTEAIHLKYNVMRMRRLLSSLSLPE